MGDKYYVIFLLTCLILISVILSAVGFYLLPLHDIPIEERIEVNNTFSIEPIYYNLSKGEKVIISEKLSRVDPLITDGLRSIRFVDNMSRYCMANITLPGCDLGKDSYFVGVHQGGHIIIQYTDKDSELDRRLLHELWHLHIKSDKHEDDHGELGPKHKIVDSLAVNGVGFIE